mmetsp:Transcript_132700/g.301570  ORF Transcript_132700/g.301570 Transcript_132700/m.301570 type:complete len:222 (+) Transcript_132700:2-667(+)
MNAHPEKRIPLQKADQYGCEMLHALKFLHDWHRKIIFQDLKPDNVVVTFQGHCKLTDFGLARADNHQGAREFTRIFVAPEILTQSTYDERVDIFSWGATMMHLVLGGRHDYEGFQPQPVVLPVPADHFVRAMLPLLRRAPNQRQERELRDSGLSETIGAVPVSLLNALEQCLCVDPEDRPKIARLMNARDGGYYTEAYATEIETAGRQEDPTRNEMPYHYD